MRTIIVGTRQSALALTQTNQVIEQLKQICLQNGLDFDFVERKIVTKGDRILDVTLSKVGGKGLFVKEIEQALLDGEIDLAVHSMKDMPSELLQGLMIGATPQRADARDCIISQNQHTLSDLPKGAKVGTSSLRRVCQLINFRPDLRLESIRGNIDSRINKLKTNGFDAIILAAAGLHRMGWEDRISEYLSPEVCIPAVAQGALGIECRENDETVLELLAKLNDPRTAMMVRAERGFLKRLDGGCQVPIGAHAVLLTTRDESSPVIQLTGMVGSPDGTEMIRETMNGTDPDQLGLSLAEKLITLGAERILADARG